MFTQQLLDYFYNPRNAGELPSPAITTEATNPACGDILQLSVLVKDGMIEAVRFKAQGCVASVACGSILTEIAKGKTLAEAAQIKAEDLSNSLGGLPQHSRHAALLAIDALQTVIKSAQKTPRETP
ncbi:MAG: hypothetical protein A3F68_01250 [Acidobacteria bacterium RIFCSPLOWO2_12_FULL_54_10]|nr:MAG: hypothetical protein A3F68_01250 [Acidobacteria bacterium RIFCSPLOWO2_12_FULL_54_10]